MLDSKKNKLLDILKRERAALLAGDFVALDNLFPIKSALFDELTTGSRKSTELSDVRIALVRNQNLLQAALDGVASARLRLNALQEVREGMHVYDQSGQLSHVSGARPGFVKRT